MTRITEPKFVVLGIEYLNGAPTTPLFGYGTKTFTTLNACLTYLGYTNFVVYSMTNRVAAIIHGTNDKTRLDAKIWTRDAAGAKTMFVANVQGFFFQGALHFAQYKAAAIKYPSVQAFNFRSTNYTQAQYEELATIILGVDKLGGRFADFKFNKFPISNALYCDFIDAEWVVVRGQTCV